MPICFHGGGQTYLRPDFSLEVFDRLMMWHVFNQPLGVMAVAVSFTGGGVLERFPNAARRACSKATARGRRGSCTASTSTTSGSASIEAPDLTMKPSEYFRRNCFLSVEVDEEHRASTTSTGSATTTSCSRPTIRTPTPSTRTRLDYFLKLPLSEESQRKILWDNFCRLYDLPLDYAPMSDGPAMLGIIGVGRMGARDVAAPRTSWVTAASCFDTNEAAMAALAREGATVGRSAVATSPAASTP